MTPILRPGPCRYLPGSTYHQSYASSYSTVNRRKAGADLFEHGIHGYIGNVPVFASAASETKYNVISEAVALDCGLEMHPLNKTLILGDGKKTTAIGKVLIEWRFEGEAVHDRLIEFLVLPNCSKPVTLGHDFLDSTRTMTTNWHRLRTKPIFEEQTPCVQILGDSKLSVAGRIRNEAIYALPASGCEVNLISGRYLTSRGLQRKVDTGNKHWLKLTNGNLVETVGEIHKNWAFGNEKWLDVWPVKFSVLPDCLYDIVLGRPFLYAADAFLRYSECFIKARPTSSHPLRGGVCVTPLILRPFMKQPGLRGALKTTGDTSILEELKRRAAADHVILKKTEFARLAAYEAEQKRRSMWNSGHHSSDHTSDPSNESTGSDEKRQDDHSSTSTNDHAQEVDTSVHDHSLLVEQRGKFTDEKESWVSNVSEYDDYRYD